MKYKFERYNYFDETDNLNKSTSLIFIENEENYGVYFSTEIKNLELDYLNEIVTSLEKVLSGELEQYDFGCEVYSIECKKEVSSVIDLYNDWKCISEIKTQEIYELIRDWRNHLIKFPCSVLSLPSEKYTFFDGSKSHKVINQYFDWFNSTDYAVWSNSYIGLNNKRIYIIKENVKVLSTFRFYSKEELESLSSKYNLQIKEENGIYYCCTEIHNTRQFEISENDDLIVIYCLQGSYATESIFIYGVYEK